MKKLLLLALLAVWTQAGTGARALTFDQRVAAHRALARVAHGHQAGTARPFDEAVPLDLIERQVAASLRQSRALETVWGVRLTPRMLHAELERMTRDGRMPSRLREMYAALDDDPVLLLECLARPALVSRLIRARFASDGAIHAEARRRAESLRQQLLNGHDPLAAPASVAGRDAGVSRWIARRRVDGGAALQQGDAAGEAPSLDSRVYERLLAQAGPDGDPGPIVEEGDAFVVRRAIPSDSGEPLVESFRVAKRSFEEWWDEVAPALAMAGPVVTEDPGSVPFPAAGVLRGDAGGARPTAAGDATGSLTAADASLDPNCDIVEQWNNGSLADPATGPPGRSYHTAVWTGGELIAWGGDDFTLPGTGERYDPVADTWLTMPEFDAPPGRIGHTAVWTGSEMIVWGGMGPLNLETFPGGARYDPATDTWSSMAPAPEGRAFHTAVWTGAVMLVYGGEFAWQGQTMVSRPGGFVYRPQTNTWSSLSDLGGSAWGRTRHTAVWSGDRMIVWGGRCVNPSGAIPPCPVQGDLNNGAAYDPATAAWTPLSSTGAPTRRSGHQAAWTGSEMIVWGGETPVALRTGARYLPASDTWTAMSSDGAPPSAAGYTSTWDGTSLTIWGVEHTGSSYRPDLDAWTALPTLNAPVPRIGHTATWTGSHIVIWGGRTDFEDGRRYARYDPAAGTWLLSPATHLPVGTREHTALWTGNEMLVWGGWETSSLAPGGARYDPALDTWTPLSTTGAPAPRSRHTGVWTGDEMVVWGGSDSSSLMATGGRYDPVSDSWLALPTAGAPEGRLLHTAAWTGSEMIVWGGQTLSQCLPLCTTTYFGTGASWSPATNEWTPLITQGAPQARSEHAAIWTGSTMLIWGGVGESGSLQTGAAFTPGVSPGWEPLPASGAPSPRRFFSTVWTGSTMIIWGGLHTGAVDTGAIFDPAAGTWSQTSTAGAPTPRIQHAAAWDGKEMIVWGGSRERSGARYNPLSDQWFPVTDTGAPAGRSEHTAVWTGAAMLVWGGRVGGSHDATGGQYSVTVPFDADNDGFQACAGDCDDADPRVHPGGRQLCGDGLNNDCGHPSWPSPAGTNEGDDDGDGVSECAGDCSDGQPTVYPGGPQICGDSLNNDCNSPIWPSVAGTEADDDLDGLSECQGDCADFNPDVYPGAPQVCDGVNNDCNDPAWPAAPDEADADADGFRACAGDCDDTRPAVYPGAPQICDGLNNDCRDPAWPQVNEEQDADGDGVHVCNGDCDDTRPAVYPGAPQICDDGLNNDCRAPGWPSLAGTNERDDDSDGQTECAGDCNDAAPTVYAGAPELCDGLNNDCNDPGWPAPGSEEVDADHDGHARCSDCDDTRATVRPGGPQLCGDGLNNNCLAPGWPSLAGTNEGDDDGDGLTECADDCDDGSAAVYTGAPQLCGDGLNNDCAHPSWPSLSGTNEADGDGDGLSACSGDCDDGDPRVYPGSPQVCDGVNNDCLDPTWPAVTPAERDEDLDGAPACADCNDQQAGVFPGAPQVCDGLNNDCQAPGWPSLAGTNEGDDDADGQNECAGDCNDFASAIHLGAPQICGDGLNNDCAHPSWPALAGTNEADDDGDVQTECNGDCDDGRGTVFAGAPQLCDGLNNDCLDPGWPAVPSGEQDADSDGFPACAECDDARPTVHPGAPQVCGDGLNNNCGHPTWPSLSGTNEVDDDGDGQSECAGDCSDSAPAVFRGAPQICGDGLNNDCADPGWPSLVLTNEADDDGDSFPECAGDCDDARTAVYPGALDVCDGINNDCNDPDWPDPGAEDSDADGDGQPVCGGDCDDANSLVHAFATQWCGDGLNNDCNHPTWPSLAGTNEQDDDGDGQSECQGDCRDSNAAVRAGAPQLCGDGLNNDCLAPGWPSPAGTNEADDDFDGFAECGGDCDDAHGTVHPGAPERCDGFNNDCLDPAWPAVMDEQDADNDGFLICDGDCDDANPAVAVGMPQVCDGVNNDCSMPGWPSLVGTNEHDADGDGFSACAGDCNDTRADRWSLPTEALDLRFALDGITLSWSAPVSPGGSAVQYDVVRVLDDVLRFVQAGTCVATAIAPTTVIDNDAPYMGGAFFYVVRAGNGCGSSAATTGSDGQPLPVRSCP